MKVTTLQSSVSADVIKQQLGLIGDHDPAHVPPRKNGLFDWFEYKLERFTRKILGSGNKSYFWNGYDSFRLALQYATVPSIQFYNTQKSFKTQ